MKTTTMIFASMLFAGAAVAEPTWYTRVAMSSSQIDFDNTPPASITERADSRETGFDIGLGYRFNANFGVELSYADLGQHDIEFACIEVLCITTPESIDANPTAVSLVGTFGLPLSDQIGVYALLGASAVDTDSFGSETDLKAGLGGIYQLSDELGLDLRYSKIVFDRFDDFDVVELGIQYEF